jgi:SSS family solute:Na+ symporter
VVIGMGARALSAGAMEPTETLPWVLKEFMHPVAAGVILAAILAAIMSTADSLLTSATSHVVKDIWLGSLARHASPDEKALLRMSRAVTVLVGLAALAIGIAVPGIVATLVYSYTMYTAGILIPVLEGVMWKGATRRGAVWAIVVGSSFALFALTTDLRVWGVPTEIYAALVSAVTFVIVSLATRETPQGEGQ